MEHDEHLTATAFNETAAPELDADGAALPERRCILTGAHGVRQELIRFAVGPDGSVAADLSAKLPGRGAWVVADREVVATAIAKGKLKGALARAFKSNALKLSDDLPDQISAGLERRALDRLGLENKAGNLIWGHERIGEALLKGKVRLLIHAASATRTLAALGRWAAWNGVKARDRDDDEQEKDAPAIADAAAERH
jgi:uncharacterized protein